jgi:hypothetical protein
MSFGELLKELLSLFNKEPIVVEPEKPLITEPSYKEEMESYKSLLLLEQAKSQGLLEQLNAPIDNNTELDKYCISKGYVLKQIAYQNKRQIGDKPITVFLHELIQTNSYELRKFAKTISDYTVQGVGSAVARYLTWKDDKQFNPDTKDYYLYPNESLVAKYCDCFAGYEKIYTEYGVKEIKDIKVGDKVLSYDFDSKEYVYKPVTKHWSKGKLQVNRVKFRNGQSIDVSENHPMWRRSGVKNQIYKKEYLSDINLDSQISRRVPIAKKIPYPKSIPRWELPLYRVIGHYLAEGWTDKKKYKVSNSGYELNEYIIPILENYNIPFTEYTNNSGVPCITILKSDFKEYLKPLKNNSFDITLTEEILSLPEEFLEELLYGMWLGDGTKVIPDRNDGVPQNKEWIYSTSSERLAKDIQRIGLQLGHSYHIWKQGKHGGVGNKPIYRITYNKNSAFLTDHGYNGISEVSIREIEKLNKVEMFDLTVDDTHTVIMENGIITHQCEDHAYVCASLMPETLGVAYGFVNLPDGSSFGHAFNVFINNNKLWLLDTVENYAITKDVSKHYYSINYIVTNKGTYVVDDKVKFGMEAR